MSISFGGSPSPLGLSLKASLGGPMSGVEAHPAYPSFPNSGTTGIDQTKAIELPSAAQQMEPNRVGQVTPKQSLEPSKYQLPSQLASYVDQIMRKMQGQYSNMMSTAMTPLPAVDGVPGGAALSSTMSQSLQAMAQMQSFNITMDMGNMVRSTVKGVTDKALEMKE